MPLTPLEIDYLRDLIARRSGNLLTGEQSFLLESRLRPVASSVGLSDVSALVSELRRSSSGTLNDRVAEALTINETSFFRDKHPFEALRHTVLPNLIRSRLDDVKLSVWSAAASSGQEPVSIAILWREYFSHLSHWQFRITATDLSDEMLTRARAACYSPFEVARGLPPELLPRYFARCPEGWRVNSDVRRLMEFRKLNLAQPWSQRETHDVIFLRNVLIYFDQPTKVAILRNVLRTLRPDGYLFVGSSETLLNLDLPLRRETIGATVVFRPMC